MGPQLPLQHSAALLHQPPVSPQQVVLSHLVSGQQPPVPLQAPPTSEQAVHVERPGVPVQAKPRQHSALVRQPPEDLQLQLVPLQVPKQQSPPVLQAPAVWEQPHTLSALQVPVQQSLSRMQAVPRGMH